MIRATVFAAVVASMSTPGHYHMRGDGYGYPGTTTCHAAERLAADHYDVVIDADGATVNGTRWSIASRDEHYLVLSHHNPGAYVEMKLTVIDGGRAGLVVLTGIDANRDVCSDSAALAG